MLLAALLPSTEVLPFKFVLALWCKQFRHLLRVARKIRCSNNKTRSLSLVFSSYGCQCVWNHRRGNTKRFPAAICPGKLPAVAPQLSCVVVIPGTGAGGGARLRLPNAFYTSLHQFAFVARLLHVFYLPWKRCSRLYLCVNGGGGGEATRLVSLWFALGWQASSDSERPHRRAHTCAHTHAQCDSHFFFLFESAW